MIRFHINWLPSNGKVHRFTGGRFDNRCEKTAGCGRVSPELNRASIAGGLCHFLKRRMSYEASSKFYREIDATEEDAYEVGILASFDGGICSLSTPDYPANILLSCGWLSDWQDGKILWRPMRVSGEQESIGRGELVEMMEVR